MSLEKALLHDGDIRVVSIDGHTSEVLVEQDVDDIGRIVIVPMDDCMIETMWSYEHERLVGVIREVPSRD
jgi:hypothetical protein